jgi:hypothetical protein
MRSQEGSKEYSLETLRKGVRFFSSLSKRLDMILILSRIEEKATMLRTINNNTKLFLGNKTLLNSVNGVKQLTVTLENIVNQYNIFSERYTHLLNKRSKIDIVQTLQNENIFNIEGVNEDRITERKADEFIIHDKDQEIQEGMFPSSRFYKNRIIIFSPRILLQIEKFHPLLGNIQNKDAIGGIVIRNVFLYKKTFNAWGVASNSVSRKTNEIVVQAKIGKTLQTRDTHLNDDIETLSEIERLEIGTKANDYTVFSSLGGIELTLSDGRKVTNIKEYSSHSKRIHGDSIQNYPGTENFTKNITGIDVQQQTCLLKGNKEYIPLSLAALLYKNFSTGSDATTFFSKIGFTANITLLSASEMEITALEKLEFLKDIHPFFQDIDASQIRNIHCINGTCMISFGTEKFSQKDKNGNNIRIQGNIHAFIRGDGMVTAPIESHQIHYGEHVLSGVKTYQQTLRGDIILHSGDDANISGFPGISGPVTKINISQQKYHLKFGKRKEEQRSTSLPIYQQWFGSIEAAKKKLKSSQFGIESITLSNGTSGTLTSLVLSYPNRRSLDGVDWRLKNIVGIQKIEWNQTNNTTTLFSDSSSTLEIDENQGELRFFSHIRNIYKIQLDINRVPQYIEASSGKYLSNIPDILSVNFPEREISILNLVEGKAFDKEHNVIRSFLKWRGGGYFDICEGQEGIRILKKINRPFSFEYEKKIYFCTQSVKISIGRIKQIISFIFHNGNILILTRKNTGWNIGNDHVKVAPESTEKHIVLQKK